MPKANKDSLGLKNPFPTSVRNLFLYNYECWMCGGNHGGNLELHHIWSRISCSVLNAAPLGRSCHDKVKDTIEERQGFLRKTIAHIAPQGYEIMLDDTEFLDMVKTDLAGFSPC